MNRNAADFAAIEQLSDGVGQSIATYRKQGSSADRCLGFLMGTYSFDSHPANASPFKRIENTSLYYAHLEKDPKKALASNDPIIRDRNALFGTLEKDCAAGRSPQIALEPGDQLISESGNKSQVSDGQEDARSKLFTETFSIFKLSSEKQNDLQAQQYLKRLKATLIHLKKSYPKCRVQIRPFSEMNLTKNGWGFSHNPKVNSNPDSTQTVIQKYAAAWGSMWDYFGPIGNVGLHFNVTADADPSAVSSQASIQLLEMLAQYSTPARPLVTGIGLHVYSKFIDANGNPSQTPQSFADTAAPWLSKLKEIQRKFKKNAGGKQSMPALVIGEMGVRKFPTHGLTDEQIAQVAHATCATQVPSLVAQGHACDYEKARAKWITDAVTEIQHQGIAVATYFAQKGTNFWGLDPECCKEELKGRNAYGTLDAILRCEAPSASASAH